MGFWNRIFPATAEQAFANDTARREFWSAAGSTIKSGLGTGRKYVAVAAAAAGIASAAVYFGTRLGGGKKFDPREVEIPPVRDLSDLQPQIGAPTMMGLEPTPGAMAARVQAGRGLGQAPNPAAQPPVMDVDGRGANAIR